MRKDIDAATVEQKLMAALHPTSVLDCLDRARDLSGRWSQLTSAICFCFSYGRLRQPDSVNYLSLCVYKFICF